MSKIIQYKKSNKQLASNLRNKSTLSEVLLWQKLKAKHLGYRFIRQKRIGNYIVDFYCKDLKLVIEIDGLSHDEKTKEDEIRQNEIEKLGIRFLRFSDGDVKRNMNDVIRTIQNWIEENRR